MATSLGQNGVMGHRHKESVQRKQSWFLPYVVLEVSSCAWLLRLVSDVRDPLGMTV